MAHQESPVMYAALYGKENLDSPASVEWMAKFVIRGFNSGESRFDQVQAASSELAQGADHIEMWRLRPEEVEQFRLTTGRPATRTKGDLMAELVAKNDGDGLAPVPAQLPPPRDVSPFPGIEILVQ